MRPLTDQQVKNIVWQYKGGASLVWLAQKHDLPYKRVRNIIVYAGIMRQPGARQKGPKRTKKPFDLNRPLTDTDRKVLELTQRGLPNLEIARAVGRSESFVQMRTHAFWNRGAR
ncbi:MAG: AsnC family protein [Candidatus Nanopelagicales bacterium]